MLQRDRGQDTACWPVSDAPKMPQQNPTGHSNSSNRARIWTGPAILTYGYRPFFLMAGAWAAFAMAAWIAMLEGWQVVPTRFDPVSWHAHEMLFGYLGAVMAGFLLTAVPNWTGRLPIIGWPLAVLSVIWLGGRVAIAFSNFLGPGIVACIDLAFPFVLAAAIGREILARKNWRNLPILILLALFATANGIFHADANWGQYAAAGPGFRMGLAVALTLICLIGGRIVPSFTRNWLARAATTARPAAFGNIDKFALISAVAALTFWSLSPDHVTTAVLSFIAGAANFIRLGRWSGWRAISEPLVWILHLGYFFVPLGFLAVSLASLDLIGGTKIGAQHIWMAGAIGIVTLAVMTRAGLGHSGLPLKATRPLTVVYLLVVASVALRFVAALGEVPIWIFHASAFSWIAGFSGFCFIYWPVMTKPRR